MATVEVTKEGLREIKEMLAGLATKDDLNALATKDDIERLEGHIGDLQRDVQEIKTHLAL